MSNTTSQEQEEREEEERPRSYRCKECSHEFDKRYGNGSLSAHFFISHQLPHEERLELQRLGLVPPQPGRGAGSSPYHKRHHENVLIRKMEARINGLSRNKKQQKQKKDNKV